MQSLPGIKEVKDFSDDLETFMASRLSQHGVQASKVMADGRVIFDRPWKRAHDLQKVLLEEWGTSLRKDEFIYQAAKSASEAFQGQFEMGLLPPIVQSGILYGLEAMVYKGMGPAWVASYRDFTTSTLRRLENKPVLWRALEIVQQRIDEAEQRIMHDFFTRREYANLEETRAQDEELKALLREQELLRDLPPGPPPQGIESNAVVKAIDEWHSRQREIDELLELDVIRVEILNWLGGHKARPSIEGPPAPSAARHP